jgi:hypothetical protein
VYSKTKYFINIIKLSVIYDIKFGVIYDIILSVIYDIKLSVIYDMLKINTATLFSFFLELYFILL